MKALFLIGLLLLPRPVLAGEIRLSAAASLKDVLNQLSDAFARKHRGVKFVRNYGGSGQLAKQIANGAPCDLFISSNLEWMDYLKERGAVEKSSVTNFTYNSLVFVGGEGRAASLKDLVRLERIAIGSPGSVPAGEYAMEALTKAGLAGQVAKKLVMARDARECLMYAERAEVDGAFVYRTDALQARRAKVLFALPRELYPKVTYPLALTVSAAKNADAAAFASYLVSKEAKAALEKYGFEAR